MAALLASLEFPEEARDVNAARLSAYIREQLVVGELTEWTIAVPSGNGETIDCNGWTFTTIARAPLETRAAGRYVVKTILSPRDEALDLTNEEFDEALEATNRRRAEAKNKKPTRVPDGPEIRRVRGKTPQRALLLLYPLSPQAANLSLAVPVFGVVVSFPDFEQRPGRQLPVQYRRTATGAGMTSLREELRGKMGKAVGTPLAGHEWRGVALDLDGSRPLRRRSP